MTRRWPYITAACVHLTFVLCAGSCDLLTAFSKGSTFFPKSWSGLFGRTEKSIEYALGKGSRRLWSDGIALYLHGAGVEAGYNFFAPHVPGSYRLVLELHYGDGRVEYEIAQGNAPGSALPVASLLDLIGHFSNDAVREHLIRLLAQDTGRQHPNVEMVRAFFGAVNFPTVEAYAGGAKASFRVIRSYDFRPVGK